MLRRILILTVFCWFAPAIADEQTPPQDGFYDPFEGFNRYSWRFNYEVLDKPLFRPATHAYARHVPFGVRESLNNVIRNLEEPASAINHLLQLNPQGAANSVVRFLFNSTFGIAGIFDIMGWSGVTRDIAEFSDTMGYYGVPDGPFLMIPVLGPSTVRNEVGDFIDGFASPLSLTWAERIIRWGVDGLYKRAAVIDQEPLLDNSLDSYTFIKDAYLQYRLYRFYRGKPPTADQGDIDSALDDYLDEIDNF
ncbi:MlaA family lipoprotein [Aliagarivorans marinus]|uniref:MlaA family lipoprotein n=1 Tax=Aliagarivorans marinus TaxID=561965 RepID=UPI000402E301|nr:VacJ family lipoprotein [Aliagarivorans marinus]